MNAITKGNKPYAIQKIKSNSYLVIWKDYTRLDDSLATINEDLRKKNFIGEIVLDLLLSNGNNASRFFRVEFNGTVLNINSIEKISNPTPSLLKKVNSFFKNHVDILHNGVLSSAEINRFISSH